MSDKVDPIEETFLVHLLAAACGLDKTGCWTEERYLVAILDAFRRVSLFSISTASEKKSSSLAVVFHPPRDVWCAPARFESRKCGERREGNGQRESQRLLRPATKLDHRAPKSWPNSHPAHSCTFDFFFPSALSIIFTSLLPSIYQTDQQDFEPIKTITLGFDPLVFPPFKPRRVDRFIRQQKPIMIICL